MASRLYDRELKCGCLISSDGGGGLMPCNYGEEFGATKKQVEFCSKCWREWRKTDDYTLYKWECIEKNNSPEYLREMLEENPELVELKKRVDEIRKK